VRQHNGLFGKIDSRLIPHNEMEDYGKSELEACRRFYPPPRDYKQIPGRFPKNIPAADISALAAKKIAACSIFRRSTLDIAWRPKIVASIGHQIGTMRVAYVSAMRSRLCGNWAHEDSHSPFLSPQTRDKTHPKRKKERLEIECFFASRTWRLVHTVLAIPRLPCQNRLQS